MTRRTFSATMLALTAASAEAGKPIRLGAPIFLKDDDPAVLAREHKRLHYTAAQCPPAKADDSARIDAIRKAYADRGRRDCGGGRVGQSSPSRCRHP